MPIQTPLPQQYLTTSAQALGERVARHKRDFDGSLCILGHHYQSDDVVRYADFVGDSLKLSRQAASTAARFIVFCGVHFMAESADILSKPDQTVILPNVSAGCTMADMAEDAAVEEALRDMARLTDARVVPVTYVNSTAAAKAITARAGGACCTSSNVRNVFAWAVRPAADGGAGAEKVFAIPDQNLGRNTAVAMGFGPADCVVYDPAKPAGGLTRDDVARAKFILWKGHCYVHQRFTPDHVRQARERIPGVRVIVHPECPYEVVQAADASGSTEQIIAAVTAAPPGSKWAIGTESNLVRRLARTLSDRTVRELSDAPSLCRQMARVTLGHLAWVLDELAAGQVVNQVTVPADIAADARLALERMVNIKATEPA